MSHQPFQIIEDNADICAGFPTLEEVFKQPKDTQDQLVLSQVVFMVRNEICALEGKISGLQGVLEKKTSLQDVENAKFTNALKELYYIARSLDAVAMTVCLSIFFTSLSVLTASQYRSSGIGVIVRKHLDNTCFAVVDGFMTIFPTFFVAAEVLNMFDKSEDSTNWKGFQKALLQFFEQHSSVQEPGSTQMFHSLWQTKSAFDFCSRNILLTVGETATAGGEFVSERTHLPKAEVFSKINLIFWDVDSKKPLIKNDTDLPWSYDNQQWDTYLKLMLNAFIPAFMWAYHELNAIIKEDEMQIHNDQSKINEQKVFLNSQVI